MTTILSRWGRAGALACALLIYTHAALAAAGPDSATRTLDAADHAELASEVSSGSVIRVALVGDRIARVVRAPGDYAVEHDPGAGDLYVRPVPGAAAPQEPVALFVGSERGFTYRLTLTPIENGPAQILIRNPATESAEPMAPAGGDARIAAIADLIRAVANRSSLEGYSVEPGGDPSGEADMSPIEVWRGPRYEAWVLELCGNVAVDAAALAARLGPDVAAVWIAESGAGPAGKPLAVAVRERGVR